jgi:hypothetical protein
MNALKWIGEALVISVLGGALFGVVGFGLLIYGHVLYRVHLELKRRTHLELGCTDADEDEPPVEARPKFELDVELKHGNQDSSVEEIGEQFEANIKAGIAPAECCRLAAETHEETHDNHETYVSSREFGTNVVYECLHCDFKAGCSIIQNY